MRLFGEEQADFQIGIDSLLKAAEKFQDQAVAVDDRTIALLRAAGAADPASLSKSESPEKLRVETREVAFHAMGHKLHLDGIEQPAQKFFVLERVGQDHTGNCRSAMVTEASRVASPPVPSKHRPQNIGST